MEITAAPKLARELTDPRRRLRAFGEAQAKKLKIRLDGLAAAKSLADFWPPKSGPERCHLLDKDLAGHFSMDLNQPYRLLFLATDVEPAEIRNDREIWERIQAIKIVGIENTHD